jgi:glyoxylase-like metal-dependent hydrolase (beta-lactamase superfamily II)
MRRVTILAALLALGGVAVAVKAAQAPQGQPQTAEIQKVKENLYVITGGGGNTAALVTAKGVVLVDTKLANWGERIMEKVRSVTDKPVTTIINTHTHGDHVGSNEYFEPSVEIVTHENTKTNMEKMDALKGKPQAMPDRTFKDRLTVGSGNDRIELHYFGRGHTNGDAWVVFPQLRVIHMGDLFPRKGTPLIDTNNGASGVEYPATLEKGIKAIRNIETVIPGHSAVTDWAALTEFTEFNRAFLTYVQAAVKGGKTVDQAIAEIKLPEKFSAYQMTGTKDNVTKIYAELGK